MINKEELEKQLNILERVAERLKNGLITSGNVAHTGMVQGAAVENVAHNIRKLLTEAEEKQHEEDIAFAKAVEDDAKTYMEFYDKGREDMKQQMLKDAVECEVKADSDGLFTTETWDEMNTLLNKIGAKAGDKVKLAIIK